MRFGGRTPVCMRCGSRAIRNQTTGEGLWAAGGEGIAWVCDDCHHIGAPFLLDEDRVDGAWEAEYREVAFAVEDETWQDAMPRRGGRFAAVVFLVLGLGFLALGGSGIVSLALRFGTLWAVVRGIVGAGWLVAIGVALMVVGVRRLGAARTAPVGDAEAPPGDLS